LVLTLCVMFFIVGAHPVGDWLAMAVRMQSPTGVGSHKKSHPLSFFQDCIGPDQ
jgi:hypothetical protein